jgi:predicted negative regulator of RcsB-dependent stress response
LTEYLTEQEQIEQLKKWFRLYGIPAALGILVGIVVFYGWNYYHSYRARILSHASRVYDEMLTNRAQNNAHATEVQAEKLLSHYPSTPYGETGALMLAREATLKKDYPAAAKQLAWVIDRGHNAALRQIARIRLARVYLAQGQSDQAIKTLKKVEVAAFQGLVDEVLGDAYLSLNQVNEARDAYQRALHEIPNADEIRPLLEMKLNNLATAV